MNTTDLATGFEVFNVCFLLNKSRENKRIRIKIYNDAYGQEEGQLTTGLCLEVPKVWSALDSWLLWTSVPFVPLLFSSIIPGWAQIDQSQIHENSYHVLQKVGFFCLF